MGKKKRDEEENHVSTILLRNAKTGEEKKVRCVQEDMTVALVAGFRPIPGDRPPRGENNPDLVTKIDD